MTPTLPSTDPPVAHASSGAFDQVVVMITLILCWASSPVSGVNCMVLT
nr:hypothetical protein [Saccharothrix sp. ALI-22-I]